MEATLARDLSDIVQLEARSLLRAAIQAEPTIGDNIRMGLNKLRDRLHETCKRFEEEGAAESSAADYLPLFDCLAVLTNALLLKPIPTEQLSIALHILKEARRERGAS